MKLFFIALLCGLFGATARAADGPITQIKVQHSSCGYGCNTDELTLNADGSAEFAGDKGVLRRGYYHGRVAPQIYQQLTDFLNESDFFDLRAEVGENRSLHFSDTIVSVQRGHLYATVVFHRGYQGKLLPQLEAICAAASAQINWQKDELASKSGVRGNITRDATTVETRLFVPHPSSVPMPYAIINVSSRDDPTFYGSTLTDASGHFQFYAPPSRYNIGAYDFNVSRPFQIGTPRWEGESLPVEVKAEQFAATAIQMRDANANAKSQ